MLIKNKGIISLEFLLSLLIILLTLTILITVNVYFKEKITNTNNEETNLELCILKNQIIEINNGELKQNDCKTIKSTNNDS